MAIYNNNPNGYRIIKTERNIKKINDHAKEGFLPVCVRIIPDYKCCPKFCLLQDLNTKKFIVFKDNEQLPATHNFAAEYKIVIPWKNCYPIPYTLPFAAYLAPPDLVAGEWVFLEDLITDHIGVNPETSMVERVKSCEAKWTGSEFLVNYKPERFGALLIG